MYRDKRQRPKGSNFGNISMVGLKSKKSFALEINEFVNEVLPRDAETRWTREFPWDIFEKIGTKRIRWRSHPEGVRRTWVWEQPERA